MPGDFPVAEEEPGNAAGNSGYGQWPHLLLGNNDNRRDDEDEEEYDSVDGLGQRQVHKEVHTGNGRPVLGKCV